MTLGKRIGAALNIESGEGRLVSLFLCHSFFMGVATVYYKTAAYTLFLSKFNADSLGKVYMGISVIGILATLLYLKLQDLLSVRKRIIANYAFLLLALASLTAALHVSQSKWLYFLLPVWYEVLMLTLTLEFWSLAGFLFDIRQSKRLFGLIATGMAVAEITGGFSVSIILLFIDVSKLLYFSMAGVVACVGIVLVKSAVYSEKLDIVDSEKRDDQAAVLAGTQEKQSFWGSLKNFYILLLFAGVIISTFQFFLLDNTFYTMVNDHYTDDKVIAGFLGHFASLNGILKLICSTFISGFLISRFGLLTGLQSGSVVVLICAAFVIVLGMNYGTIPAVFWLIVVGKLMFEVLENTIGGPAFFILYQALPARQRDWAKAAVDGIVGPIAVGLVGALLWFLTSFLAFNAIQLYGLLTVFLISGFFVNVMIRKEYTAKLTDALTSRQLDLSSLNLQDNSTLSIMMRGLESNHPGEVFYCIDLLEQVEYDKLFDVYVKLLSHPSPKIRREVLRKLEMGGHSQALVYVRKLIETEESPEVLGESLRALASLADEEADTIDRISPYLEYDDHDVRTGALVGLIRSGGIEGVMTAGETLVRLVQSESASERAFAARLFGEIGISSFYRPLLKLLNDRDIDVRKAALVTAGKLKNRRLVPQLILALKRTEIRATATHSLIEFGATAITELDEIFDRPQAGEIQSRLMYIVGRIGGDEAVDVLKKRIGYERESVRHTILHGLVSCGYRARTTERDTVIQLIKDEVNDAAWAIACQADLSSKRAISKLSASAKSSVSQKVDDHFPDDDVRSVVAQALKQCGFDGEPHQADKRIERIIGLIKEEVSEAVTAKPRTQAITDDTAILLLIRALEIEAKRNVERILYLLSFIFSAHAILNAKNHLFNKNTEKKSTALEVIENVISQDLKEMVFPLLENVDADQRLRKLNPHFPQTRLGIDDRLMDIVDRDETWVSSWTVCCALYVMAQFPKRKYQKAVLQRLSVNNSSMVRETAMWTLRNLEPDDLQEHLKDLMHDESVHLVDVATYIIDDN